MNQAHIKHLGEEELLKGLLPLMNHPHWAYLEEYLLREQSKAIKQMANLKDSVDLHRAQGKYSTLALLLTLKHTLMTSLRK